MAPPALREPAIFFSFNSRFPAVWRLILCAVALAILGYGRIGDAGQELRYWAQPFRATGLEGAYVSVIVRNDQLEFWRGVGEAGPASVRRLGVRRGNALAHLGQPEVVLDSTSINDLFSGHGSNRLSIYRQFTRSSVGYFEGVGYVHLASVIRRYQPGRESLSPALFSSPSGVAGDWRYLGKLTGEPTDFAATHYVWSDGGSLLRRADGGWRIYLNGYGVRLAALEADALRGPWRFLRRSDGRIRELASALTGRSPRGEGYAFPTVVQIGDEWHAWLSDAWPTASIWHLWSRDGLDWRLYRDQPEITRAAVNGKPIKCLRVYSEPGGKYLVGLLSVWEGQADTGTWMLYRSRLPLNRLSDEHVYSGG